MPKLEIVLVASSFLLGCIPVPRLGAWALEPSPLAEIVPPRSTWYTSIHVSVDASRYPSGTQIGGDRAHGRLILDLDLAQMIERDVSRVWGKSVATTRPGSTSFLDIKVRHFEFIPSAAGRLPNLLFEISVDAGRSAQFTATFHRHYESSAPIDWILGEPLVWQSFKRAYSDAMTMMLKDPELWSFLSDPSTDPGAPSDRGPPAAGRREQVPTVVAVFPLQDPNGVFPLDERDQLDALLETALVRSGAFRVVPRSEILERLLDEKATSYSPCYDEGCQIEIGKELSAERVVSSRILRLGDECTLVVMVFDLASETGIQSSDRRVDCAAEPIAEALEEIAEVLATSHAHH